MSRRKFISQAQTGGAAAETASSRNSAQLTTVKIAYIAMFAAMNVVIGALSPRLGTIKITLTYTLLFLAGYFFGALTGGLTGLVGDLLGCLIGGFMPNPIIIAASCLLGVIPAAVKHIKIDALKDALPYAHILMSFAACFVICTLFINTYALYVIGLGKGATFWAYMSIRAASQSPVTALNFVLTLLLFPVFKRIFAKSSISAKA